MSEYWIVNPDERTIVVYDFENDKGDVIIEYSFESKITPRLYKELVIDFEEISRAIE